MRIGLDFDNTIVCYDQAIAKLAEDLFELPSDLPRSKIALRDFLLSSGRESDWTAFQGELYGPGMRYAIPFKNSVEVMTSLVSAGHTLAIVSHRSREPYAGRKYDLHQAAREWVDMHLRTKGLFGSLGDDSLVFFLETKELKLKMVEKLECDVFVDDLPEILNNRGFPFLTNRVLFKPSNSPSDNKPGGISSIGSWLQLPGLIQ